MPGSAKHIRRNNAPKLHTQPTGNPWHTASASERVKIRADRAAARADKAMKKAAQVKNHPKNKAGAKAAPAKKTVKKNGIK
jgi:hypothetical protein